jgi:signal transduction histidine kinase/DNA-binding response OmpR family regulator/streptogramin lyase
MRSVSLLLLLSLLPPLLGGALAQPVANGTTPYRRHTTADGLPHEDIWALAQAGDGRLWIGTADGLGVFDGETFRRVALPDPVGPGIVNSILARPDGSAWVSVREQGLAKLRGGRVVRSVPTDQWVRRIVARDDTLHVFMRTARWTLPLGSEQQQSFQRQPYDYWIELSKAGAGRGARDAAVAPDGSHWILDSKRGLARLHRDGSVRFISSPPGALPDWETLRFTETGAVLIACNDGTLYRFDPDTEQFRVLLRTENPVAHIRLLEQDGRRVAILGTHGGVLRYDLTRDRRLPPLDRTRGISPRLTRTVVRDHEGGLWLGTPEGLLHLYAPHARQHTSLGGRALSYKNVFTADARGRPWLRTWTAGLFRLRPGVERFVPDSSRLFFAPITSRDGGVHTLGAGGWHRYGSSGESSGGKWETRAPQAIEAMRGCVSERGAGYFWKNDGLYRLAPTDSSSSGSSGDDHRSLTRLTAWPKDDVDRHAFTLSPRGRLVVRAGERLLRGTPRPGSGRTAWRFEEIARLPDRFAGARGYQMAADAQGAVWLSFRKQGLVRVNPREGDRPASVRRVASGRFEHITTAGDSLVLAGSTQGLAIAGQHEGTLLRRLTRTDGLLSTRVFDAMIYRDSLYAAHPTGITILPLPALGRSASSAPHTLLTSVGRGSTSVSPAASSAAGPADFSASERTVGFDFAATAFADPQRTRYEYRLPPRDTAWQSTTNSFVRYTDLPPGAYRFEVRARSSHRAAGASVGEAASYAFAIPPHFYETTWFRLLLVLGLGALTAAAYRWRVRALRRRQRELEAAVDDRTEALRREKETTEEQAERLAELDDAKSRFFANVSHEFRTPLTLITGSLQALLDERHGPVTGAQAERLSLARRSADRLLELVEQLLDLARLDAGRLQLDARPGDLTSFLRERVRTFTPLAERERVALHFRPGGDSDDDRALRCAFDRDKLGKVVDNLLSNALKFTPEGGDVWLSVHLAPDDASTVEMVVKDNGPGLPEGELEALFDRFEQSDDAARHRSREGAGIGLALARDLVELHDGTIRVRSEPGHGAAFIVRLPVQGAKGERRLPNDESAQQNEHVEEQGGRQHESRRVGRSGQSEDRKGVPPRSPSQETEAVPLTTTNRQSRILVVEDNADVRALLRDELGEAGCEIVEAADGAEGLDKARSHGPDLVISDVMMPEMDGFALCEAIKTDEALAATPVLLLTAKADAASRQRGLERCADAYVPKPFDAAVLRARIASLLTNRRRLREAFGDRVLVESSGKAVPEETASLLEDALAAVDDRLGDPHFTTEDLAAAVALSRRQLSRRLKEAIGETPATFIRRVRLEHAAALLASDGGDGSDDSNDGERSVSEVAYTVGYSAPSSFSRAFRERFGCAPSAYDAAAEEEEA